MNLKTDFHSDCPRKGRAERKGVGKQNDLCSNLDSVMN